MSKSSAKFETLKQTLLDAWKLPEKLKPSQWAERYRVLSNVETSEPGRWSNDRTPYLVGIMDATCEPGVEEVVFLKPTRVGGSECLRNLVGYWADNDPGPLMMVMPSEQAANELIRDCIRPLFEKTPRLRSHLSPRREDNTQACIKLDTMAIYTGWAGSPQSLASKLCRRIGNDEIDKYPPHDGKEADAVSLSAERTITYGHRKLIYKTSTPTTREGPIYKAFEACQDKRRFHVPCPHCGAYQVLNFAQVKWPKLDVEKEALADAVEQGRLAWYECSSCKGIIKDHHKPKMLIRGIWVSEGQTIDKGGLINGERPKSKRVGFHLNSLYSPWCNFSGIAAEFMRAKGDVALTQNFRNSRMAEPFEEQIVSAQPSAFEKLKIDAPKRNELPSWAEILICTADVQQDSLWFVVRAWARGFRSQLFDYGNLLNFEELYDTAFGKHRVSAMGIDGRYRTSEVLTCARRLPSQIFVMQGNPNPTAVMCEDRLREGLRYLTIGPELTKDRLQQLLADADPTRWRVHSEIDDVYCNQMASEHKVFDPKMKRFSYKPKYKGIANHLYDCEANNIAMATWLGMDSPMPDAASPQPESPTVETSFNPFAQRKRW